MSIERPTVTQIIVGFSDETDGCRATGSVTLVEQSGLKILIDCGDPWNGGELINKLMQKGTACSEITHVVITHGHVDHCGNLNLFKNAQIFMAFDYVTPDGIYSAIDKTDGYQISEQIKVTLAKGHTSVDLIVEVINTIHGTIIIAGDIFESEKDEDKWQQLSEYPEEHLLHRQRILEKADIIIPGHGEMFTVVNKISS